MVAPDDVWDLLSGVPRLARYVASAARVEVVSALEKVEVAGMQQQQCPFLSAMMSNAFKAAYGRLSRIRNKDPERASAGEAQQTPARGPIDVIWRLVPRRFRLSLPMLALQRQRSTSNR